MKTIYYIITTGQYAEYYEVLKTDLSILLRSKNIDLEFALKLSDENKTWFNCETAVKDFISKQAEKKKILADKMAQFEAELA